MGEYSEENNNTLVSNAADKISTSAIDMESIYMNPAEVFTKQPMNSEPALIKNGYFSSNDKKQSDFENRIKNNSQTDAEQTKSQNHIAEIITGVLYIFLAGATVMAYTIFHLLNIELTMLFTAAITILSIVTIGRKSEALRAFISVYSILFVTFVASELLMGANISHLFRKQILFFASFMIISFLNSFIGRKDKIAFEWIRIVTDIAYYFALTFMLICNNAVYGIKYYIVFIAALWITSFVNIVVFAKSHEFEENENLSLLKSIWFAKNAANIIVIAMATYLILIKCELGMYAVIVSAAYILINYILGMIFHKDLESDTYIRFLSVVVASILCNQLGIISELVGSGILFLPLILIYVISKRKNAFWYVYASYTCFAILGMTHLSIFAFEGLMMGVLLLLALLYIEKTADSGKGYLLYFSVSVFLVRLFGAFLSYQANARAMVLNILFICFGLLYVMTFLWKSITNNEIIENKEKIESKEKTENIDGKVKNKGNTFLFYVGNVLFIFGLIICVLTKSAFYLAVSSALVIAIFLINVYLTLKSINNVEAKNIILILEALIFLQVVLRTWGISGLSVSLACAVGILGVMFVGFSKNQKSLRQDSIIIFTVLMLWIMVVDTNQLPIVLRGLIVIFCLMVAFTVIVIYNLLEKKKYGDNTQRTKQKEIAYQNPFVPGNGMNQQTPVNSMSVNNAYQNPFVPGNSMNQQTPVNSMSVNNAYQNPFVPGNSMNQQTPINSMSVNNAYQNPFVPGNSMNQQMSVNNMTVTNAYQSPFMPGGNMNRQMPSNNMTVTNAYQSPFMSGNNMNQQMPVNNMVANNAYQNPFMSGNNMNQQMPVNNMVANNAYQNPFMPGNNMNQQMPSTNMVANNAYQNPFMPGNNMNQQMPMNNMTANSTYQNRFMPKNNVNQ